MRAETFQGASRELRRRRPFEPYTVELFGGERIVVTHPEALAVYDDLATYYETDGVSRYFDATSVLQVYSIVVPPR